MSRINTMEDLITSLEVFSMKLPEGVRVDSMTLSSVELESLGWPSVVEIFKLPVFLNISDTRTMTLIWEDSQ